MIWHPYTVQKNSPPPLKISSAKGEFVFDENGKKYIDSVSSWWVSIHGHNHPFIIKELKTQLDKLDHILLAGFTNEPAERLAEELILITKGKFKKVFYSDNGSCGVEIALKMSIQYFKNLGYKNKTKFIKSKLSYHGDTIGAMAAGGTSIYNELFYELFFKTKEFNSPDCNNCPWNKKPDKCSLECLNDIEKELQNNADEYAGLIIEPLIFGANGMRFYKPEVLKQIESLCNKYDVLFILDEVFTGFGRTGTDFAYEKAGVSPDIIILAKGISGGFLPLAATLVNEKVYSAFYSDKLERSFLHGHTMTGNPLTTTAGLASLTLYKNENRLKDAKNLETWFLKFQNNLKENSSDKINNARTLGAVFAFELGIDNNYKINKGRELMRLSLEKGLLIRPLGNTVYLTPPYNISTESLEKIQEIIISALKEIII